MGLFKDRVSIGPPSHGSVCVCVCVYTVCVCTHPCNYKIMEEVEKVSLITGTWSQQILYYCFNAVVKHFPLPSLVFVMSTFKSVGDTPPRTHIVRSGKMFICVTQLFVVWRTVCVCGGRSPLALLQIWSSIFCGCCQLWHGDTAQRCSTVLYLVYCYSERTSSLTLCITSASAVGGDQCCVLSDLHVRIHADWCWQKQASFLAGRVFDRW